MNNANKFFDGLESKVLSQIYTSAVGKVDRISGKLLDVNVSGLPLLINTPYVAGYEPAIGDTVLLTFLNSDISDAVVIGKLEV